MVEPARRSNLLFLTLLFALYIAPFDNGAAGDRLPWTGAVVAGIALLTAELRKEAGGRGCAALHRSPALPLLLFLLFASASCLWSIDRFVTLLGVGRVAACAGVFLVVMRRFGRGPDARTLAWALAVLAVSLALLGVWQGLMGRGLYEMPGGGARAHSVFAQPNTFAAFLIVVLPLLVALAATEKQRAARCGLLFGVVLCAAGLVLSRSRGAWTAGAVGFGIFVWQAMRLGLIVRRWRRALTWGCVGAAVAGAALILWLRPAGPNMLRERLWFWESAGAMAANAMPLGIGLDTYHIDYPAHQSPHLAGTEAWFAHNDYLQILVELGPAGFVLLVWLLWSVFRRHGRAVISTGNAGEGLLVAAYGAGAAAGLLHSLIEFNLYVPGTALPLFACLGVVSAQAAAASEAGALWRRRAVVRAVVLAAGVAAAIMAFLPLAGERFATAGLLHLRAALSCPPGSAEYERHWESAERATRMATVLCPLSASFWRYRGEVAACADADSTRACFEEAVRRSPRSAVMHACLGGALVKIGKIRADSAETDSGLDHLRRACALYPFSAAWRLALGAACFETGHDAEARENLRWCLDRCRPTKEIRERAEALLNAHKPDSETRPSPPPALS